MTEVGAVLTWAVPVLPANGVVNDRAVLHGHVAMAHAVPQDALALSHKDLNAPVIVRVKDFSVCPAPAFSLTHFCLRCSDGRVSQGKWDERLQESRGCAETHK